MQAASYIRVGLDIQKVVKQERLPMLVDILLDIPNSVYLKI